MCIRGTHPRYLCRLSPNAVCGHWVSSEPDEGDLHLLQRIRGKADSPKRGAASGLGRRHLEVLEGQ